jgi:glycosyltransferase involved in cell wall biosynthesis
MNICIDMRPALSRATGVGVYLQNLVHALSELDSSNAYYLFSSSWKERFHLNGQKKNFIVCDRRFPVRLLTYSWNRLSFPPIESLLEAPLDIVHSPTPLVIPTKTAHQVTTVHDLYFYFHPEQVIGEMQRDYPEKVYKHCVKSDAIIAVSEYTKSQLVDHLKIASSKIYTVHHGADPFFAEPQSGAEFDKLKKTLSITQPYFLFVGTQEPRKNLPTLMEAFEKMEPVTQLVLCGLEGWGEELSGFNLDRVIRTGYVSRNELRLLYQNAIALVMPSLDEGFGLPILEAMTAGAPVVASGIPAFLEIGADAFLPVNPQSATQLRNALETVQSDASLRERLIVSGKERAKKFTWKEAAQKTLDIYSHL